MPSVAAALVTISPAAQVRGSRARCGGLGIGHQRDPEPHREMRELPRRASRVDNVGRDWQDEGRSRIGAMPDSIRPGWRAGGSGFTMMAYAPELDPPFEIIEPAGPRSNVVLSSPHSGDVYPDRFIACARLDRQALRRSEDAFVDQLFRGGVACGAPLIRARFPRAFIDVNREPYELDPRMFDGRLPSFANTRSPRVAGGLGTIARVVGEAQEIYARRLSVDEAILRIDTLYKPYHAQLRQLLEEAQHCHGAALLIDCHSMPSAIMAIGGFAQTDERLRADVVLGDRYGTSCDRRLVDVAESTLKGFGYAVARNRPYAGGFITEHYGHPATHRHALQVEINRSLYMDERSLQPSAGFGPLARHLGTMVAHLTEVMSGETRAAAE